MDRKLPPFHLAIPVHDLAGALEFKAFNDIAAGLFDT
jgi:extradiol dioxygenase family protein